MGRSRYSIYRFLSDGLLQALIGLARASSTPSQPLTPLQNAEPPSRTEESLMLPAPARSE